jgi:sugar/nucleoside kinase (ribokinase family)
VPAIQLGLLEQVDKPTFVAADTMNLWIQEHLTDLKILLKKIDCLIINEDEARMLADEFNLMKAARKILDMGMNLIVIKKGESGSFLCNPNGDIFILPAYPATQVVDPTGAGDCFAGGFMGYLAKTGKTDFKTLKTAIAYGTVVASFAIADFSLKGLTGTDRANIDKRLDLLRNTTKF